MRSLSNVFLDKEESPASEHKHQWPSFWTANRPKCFLNPASVGFVFCKIKVWQKGRELSLSVNNGPFADFCSSTEKKCFLQLWKANIVEHSNVSALFNFQMKNLQENVLFSGSPILWKKRSTLISSEKVWAHSFPHSPHPKSYEFICRASFVWVFAREEAEGGGNGFHVTYI